MAKHKLDLDKLATVVGGVLVTASPRITEVRMRDNYHTVKSTSELKLPVVFKGTTEDIRAWAKTNNYREVADRDSLFGVYYVDKHDQTYTLT